MSNEKSKKKTKQEPSETTSTEPVETTGSEIIGTETEFNKNASDTEGNPIL